MNAGVVILVVLGVIVVIAALVKLGQILAERERRRIHELEQWALASGFTYSKNDPHDLDNRFRGVLDIGRGHDRYAYEVLARSDPVPAFIFRYHFKTWETRTVTYRDAQGRTHTRTERYEQSHHRRYLFIQLGSAFPRLALRREGWFDKVAGLMCFDDVNFESEQFSRRYFVKSADRQFAYAVIHPQMMEWLLPRDFSAQLEGELLLMVLGSTHDAAGCHAAWSEAAGFINRLPRFVWEDYGKRPPIVLPESVAPVQPVEG